MKAYLYSKDWLTLFQLREADYTIYIGKPNYMPLHTVRAIISRGLYIFLPQFDYSSSSNYSWLKTVAFIAGKKNPAVQKFYIHFSIEIKL